MANSVLNRFLKRILGNVGDVLGELNRKGSLVLIVVIMFAASIAEIVGVASIAPFVNYVATGNIGNPLLKEVVGAMPFSSPIVGLGLLSFTALLIGNALQVATTYSIFQFTWRAGEILSTRIFENLLARPYASFLSGNSSEALTTLSVNVTSTVANVLVPLLSNVARFVSIFAIVTLLVGVEPMIAAIAFLVAGGSYFVVFKMLAPLIAKHGRKTYSYRIQMHKIAAEMCSGIAEVKVFSCEAYFAKRFAAMAHASGAADARSQIMRQVPRYAIEAVAFGGMIIIVIVLVSTRSGSGDVWPLLAIYAVAAWRLLPSAQQIFHNVTSIRHHWAALEAVNRELGQCRPAITAREAPPSAATAGTARGVEFRDVRFSYSEGMPPVLDGLSFRVEAGEILGIVGPSGTGKTTILALALGLLEPRAGTVHINGLPPQQLAAGGRVAYVPQHPAFQDDSIRRNVAFGIDDDAIDDGRVRAALAATGLLPTLEALPQGLATRVGEHGSNLSGGQRQRLALARALYRDPVLIVLDEFTSALDDETERQLLDVLEDMLAGRTVLTVTHRSDVLRICHRVLNLAQRRLS
ncbi:Heterocyst differentiation ATP-binding protein HepA [Blastochloris viridis]|uniref:Iron import ATP-binding/permease protein IrtB n=2 Tax=Blastochloris viridis TaxID=1079 RepID=A0A0H5B8S3_BLAVI|nr:Heterocyst differentiation ATP-binding protein HepA [Blastochloris viridis]BAR98610.1 probable ABC transporter protein [Blastochloris viridis]CUU44047.1 Iron import ATP-binding/permease protein IrtB [Blastochloris viridis]